MCAVNRAAPQNANSLGAITLTPSTHSPSWQRLIGLESRDTVTAWHGKLTKRELSARRTKEITSAAKQAREFFRNAFAADYSVRPLLAFYGVASLSRALALLLRRNGGEETLPRSHGLSAVNWSGVMSGDLSPGLSALGSLEIGTTAGLFASFLEETRNTLCVHVRSSAVDWRLPYPVPAADARVTLEDLLLRVPDLHHEHMHRSQTGLYARVNEMTFSTESGFKAKVHGSQLEAFKDAYASAGYTMVRNGDWYDLSADVATFEGALPQLIHTYVHMTFGSIPSLHLAKPFDGGQRYSQLAVTYMLAYCFGMLSRYYPTHWIALLSGEKGDALWPSINAAQRYVETCFPNLIDEFLHDALRQAEVAQSEPPAVGLPERA